MISSVDDDQQSPHHHIFFHISFHRRFSWLMSQCDHVGQIRRRPSKTRIQTVLDRAQWKHGIPADVSIDAPGRP